MSLLIYGANGYTGKLIVKSAIALGLKPIIAGRSPEKIKRMAQDYTLEYRVFGLEVHDSVVEKLKDVSLVLHCAGPFSKTAKPMVEACLEAGVHYLDITGELAVFEMIKTYNAQAKAKQIVLMPGVGFDVVPTDCVAAILKEKLPDASHLELAFASLGGGVSHGTMSTMVENLGNPGAIRVEGSIIQEPIGKQGKTIDFGIKPRFAMTIPWGDVSTAHHTTGIPNICVYTAVPKNSYRMMKLQFLFNPLLRIGFVKKKIQAYVDKNISGPTAEENETAKSLVWGAVYNRQGDKIEARLECAGGYALTAAMSLHIAQQLMKTHEHAGYYTPAGLFGHQLILALPDSKWL